jgi:hypothetical protein
MTAEDVSPDADRVFDQTSADRQPISRGVERRPLLRRRFTLAGLTLGFGLGAGSSTFGLFLLWRVLSAGYQVTWRSMLGLLLAGWGCSTSSKVSSTIISSPSTTCATMSLTHCRGMSASSPSGPS